MRRAEGREPDRQILQEHLVEGQLRPGEPIALPIDQTLLQDGTGPADPPLRAARREPTPAASEKDQEDRGVEARAQDWSPRKTPAKAARHWPRQPRRSPATPDPAAGGTCSDLLPSVPSFALPSRPLGALVCVDRAGLMSVQVEFTPHPGAAGEVDAPTVG